MTDLEGMRRLAERCAADSPVRHDFAAVASAIEDSRRGGGAGQSQAANIAIKRLLAARACDLHDIALKSAMALELLRFNTNGTPIDGLLELLGAEIVRVGAPSPENQVMN